MCVCVCLFRRNENKHELCIHIWYMHKARAHRKHNLHSALFLINILLSEQCAYKDPQSPIAWSIQHTEHAMRHITPHTTVQHRLRRLSNRKRYQRMCPMWRKRFFRHCCCQDGLVKKKYTTKCIKPNERLNEPNEQWTKMRIKTEWQLYHKWKVK